MQMNSNHLQIAYEGETCFPLTCCGTLLCLVLHFKGGIQHPGELHLSAGRGMLYYQFAASSIVLVTTDVFTSKACIHPHVFFV